MLSIPRFYNFAGTMVLIPYKVTNQLEISGLVEIKAISLYVYSFQLSNIPQFRQIVFENHRRILQL